MTPEEPEAFYDEEVAPVLMDLGRKLQDRGMGMVALVDYTGTGQIAETVTLPEKAPTLLRWAKGLASADAGNGQVNVDSFMFAVMKEAREKGHSSMILKQLGVPTSPGTHDR